MNTINTTRYSFDAWRGVSSACGAAIIYINFLCSAESVWVSVCAGRSGARCTGQLAIATSPWKHVTALSIVSPSLGHSPSAISPSTFLKLETIVFSGGVGRPHILAHTMLLPDRRYAKPVKDRRKFPLPTFPHSQIGVAGKKMS